MIAIQSLKDLNHYKEDVLENKAREAKLGKVQVVVSLGTCGIAAGAQQTFDAIQTLIETEKLTGITVSKTGCDGQCKEEPIIRVITADQRKVVYGKVSPEVARRILKEHVLGGKIVDEYVI